MKRRSALISSNDKQPNYNPVQPWKASQNSKTRQTFRQMHIQSAYSPWSDAIRLPLFPVFDADVPALLAVASDAGPKLVWIGGLCRNQGFVGSCWIKIAQGMRKSCQTSFCSRRFLSCNWANNTRCW